MEEFILLREINRANERAKRNLIIYRRRLRDESNYFEIPENEFRKIYRLSRIAVRDLVEELTPFMPEKQRISGIPIHLQILATLDFIASGSYQRRVGNSVHSCMSQSSISLSIHHTIDAIQEIIHRWIRFPSTLEEMELGRNRFEEKFGFPGVVGVIDGTHVCITPPHSDIEEAYFNRKGFHSLNVMIVTDADNRILSLNARYGGRVNDARVYNNSMVKAFMERKYEQGLRGYWLLGDSGYGCSSVLITPVQNPVENTPEARFNSRLKYTRASVENSIGILKGTCRCLRKERGLHYEPETAGKIVNVGCVLHNIRKHYRFPHVEEMYDEEHNEEPVENVRHDEERDEVRQTIIQDFFT